jgi:AraC-like DNA-binding protein
MKILIIEFGIKNIEILKKKIIQDNIDIVYTASFLDVVDTIYNDKVNVIIFSSFRGKKSTIGYIKMFRTTNINFRLIILSDEKTVSSNDKSLYIQMGADSHISSYDYDEINKRLENIHQIYLNDNEIDINWSECTKRVVRFLKNNYSSLRDNILFELTRNTGFSESSICHNIIKDTGITAVEWIQSLRIKGALELMKSTDLTIKEISSHVGYKSVQGFIKLFKKYKSISPNQYRKSQS